MEDQLQTSNGSAALCPCQHEEPLTGQKNTSQDPQIRGLPLTLSSVCEADFPLPASCWGQQLSFLAKDTSKHTDSWVNSAARSPPSGRSTVFPKSQLSHPTDSQQGKFHPWLQVSLWVQSKPSPSLGHLPNPRTPGVSDPSIHGCFCRVSKTRSFPQSDTNTGTEMKPEIQIAHMELG